MSMCVHPIFFFKVLHVKPVYVLISPFSWVTVALYIISVSWHFPSTGHFSFSLQLQFFLFSGVGGVNSFLLLAEMADPMFGVHL